MIAVMLNVIMMSVIMMSVIMMSVIMLNVVMLSVIMLSVIMSSVALLSVIAPLGEPSIIFKVSRRAPKLVLARIMIHVHWPIL
jgi:hypothetical protein